MDLALVLACLGALYWRLREKQKYHLMLLNELHKMIGEQQKALEGMHDMLMAQAERLYQVEKTVGMPIAKLQEALTGKKE